MINFDFITNKQFRESLESDYRELQTCFENSAWKSVQVAAGSIVEALLIDYLQNYQEPTRTLTKDVLKIDLSEAIVACQKENVLTARTAELCGVIRSYRNLIHPGRIVRTNEPQPNKSDATIAVELVTIIAKEVANTLKAKVGLTAEQVLSKIKRDERAPKLLRHLLVGFNENQRKRLLFDLIPAAHYAESLKDNEDWGATEDRMRDCHRIIFDDATEETKRAFMKDFCKIIKEDDGESILWRTNAYFYVRDLQFVNPDHTDLVLENFLHTLSKAHPTIQMLQSMRGIQHHIHVHQVGQVIDPLLKALVGLNPNPPYSNQLKSILFDIGYLGSEDVREAFRVRLTVWSNHYKTTAPEKSKMIIEVRDDDMPF